MAHKAVNPDIMVSNGVKKQACYAGGTLLGWSLAKSFGAKETVPFTVLGGLIGFMIGENQFSPDAKPRKPAVAVAGIPRKSGRKTV